ncbi:hypothetical protein [Aurantiacibacter rhizosphaerae]|uniref:Uncharacterized protein n=1 Tax=Aurantiacibacter rhizosphaerae TaxID=2691582 RepID=A0A844XCC3_9SPHN|nr:hypothetical protein [Aurantiacibacter rhizosphaerae]MWV27480.1 hypothetical protein [Aurantiacibacter rhizosphaerae]
MSNAVPALFAAITAKLEDLHAIAIEGQRRDNSPDIQRALARLLRSGTGSINRTINSVGKQVDASDE